ncbi:transmembrane protein, putative [Medicago truncatula]|uniref:Transmembrane protein, putative n=1 Tax=Medicago truncatula TaxID=3880 RepID=A0A072VBX0_MEDTR|nr:transmembrane protein, putative [Medicago truncatula]
MKTPPAIKPQSHFLTILHFVPNFTFHQLVTLTSFITLAFSGSAWLSTVAVSPTFLQPIFAETPVIPSTLADFRLFHSFFKLKHDFSLYFVLYFLLPTLFLR